MSFAGSFSFCNFFFSLGQRYVMSRSTLFVFILVNILLVSLCPKYPRKSPAFSLPLAAKYSIEQTPVCDIRHNVLPSFLWISGVPG